MIEGLIVPRFFYSSSFPSGYFSTSIRSFGHSTAIYAYSHIVSWANVSSTSTIGSIFLPRFIHDDRQFELYYTIQEKPGELKQKPRKQKRIFFIKKSFPRYYRFWYIFSRTIFGKIIFQVICMSSFGTMNFFCWENEKIKKWF